MESRLNPESHCPLLNSTPLLPAILDKAFKGEI